MTSGDPYYSESVIDKLDELGQFYCEDAEIKSVSYIQKIGSEDPYALKLCVKKYDCSSVGSIYFDARNGSCHLIKVIEKLTNEMRLTSLEEFVNQPVKGIYDASNHLIGIAIN